MNGAHLFIIVLLILGGASILLKGKNMPESPEWKGPVTYPDRNYQDKEFYTPEEIRDLSGIEILARTLYGEGRSLSDREVYLIGWVIKNRGKASWYPDSLKEICLQPSQFSCWNEYNFGTDQNDFDNESEVMRVNLSESYQYSRMRRIAENVIMMEEETNPIPGVYNYIKKSNRLIIDPVKKTVYNPYKGGGTWRIVNEEGDHLFLTLT